MIDLELGICESNSVHTASMLTSCFKEVALTYSWEDCVLVCSAIPWILILNGTEISENTDGGKRSIQKLSWHVLMWPGNGLIKAVLSSSNFELNKLFKIVRVFLHGGIRLLNGTEFGGLGSSL